MASPIPKAASQRQRRNRTTSAATMEAPAATKVPLPQRYSIWQCVSCYLVPGKHTAEFFDKEEINPHDFAPALVEWRPVTLAWWETIWDSPMADEWVDADVPGLLAVALLVDEFWRTGDSRLAAEIRMQQREYGLSPLSRRQLQWEIKRLETTARPPAQPPARRRGASVLGVLQGGKRAG